VQEYEYQIQVLQIFQEFLINVNKKLDLDELGNYITDYIKKTFQSKECSLMVNNQRFSSEQNIDMKKVETERIAVKEAAKKQSPLLLQNIKTDSLVFDIKNEVEEALLSIPIFDEETIVACINIYDDINHIHKKEVELVTEFVTKASASISNAIKYNLLKKKSHTDYLTGVYNRHYFIDRLAYEINRMKNGLSILLFDIDFFKVYNDTNGHLAGDTLLKELAELIQIKLRPSDIIGRYGGEEFIVILPEIEGNEAEEVAERLRKAVEDQPFKARETQPTKKVTISIGITTTHMKMQKEELVKEADKNLYHAKKSGRNRWVSSVILKNGYVTTVNP